jgi:hypothetical protein
MGRGFLRSASVAAAITLVLSTVSITQSKAQNAQFKGWAAVSRELSTRLAAPGASLDLQKFVPADDLDELLGTWNRFGEEHTLQNGSPNYVSMVIWRVALSGFARAWQAPVDRPA